MAECGQVITGQISILLGIPASSSQPLGLLHEVCRYSAYSSASLVCTDYIVQPESVVQATKMACKWFDV